MTTPTPLANIYYDLEDHIDHHSSTSMNKQALHPGIVQQTKCLVQPQQDNLPVDTDSVRQMHQWDEANIPVNQQHMKRATWRMVIRYLDDLLVLPTKGQRKCQTKQSM